MNLEIKKATREAYGEAIKELGEKNKKSEEKRWQ